MSGSCWYLKSQTSAGYFCTYLAVRCICNSWMIFAVLMPLMMFDIANWMVGLSMDRYNPVPAACLKVAACSSSKSSSMSRLPLPVALTTGVGAPLESSFRPVSRIKSSACFGLASHSKPSGVHRMMRPRCFPSVTSPPNAGGPMRGSTFVSKFSVSTRSISSSAAAVPPVRKSSPWHVVVYLKLSELNIIGTTMTCFAPSFCIVLVTSLPQHLLASRVPYMAFKVRHPMPGGAMPLGGMMTTRPDPVAWKNATRMSCRPIK